MTGKGILYVRTIRWRVTANGAYDSNAGTGLYARPDHGPEHGSAASLDAWRSAAAAGSRRRNHRAHHARHRVSAHRHREDLRGEVLSAGRADDRSHRLSLPH